MARLSKQTPRTFGELRALLAELGNPWVPDPSRSDDEPLSDFPTGGDGVYEPPDRVLSEGGVIEVLKRRLPANPDLLAVWREEGLAEEASGAGGASSRPKQSRGRKKISPAPDSGG